MGRSLSGVKGPELQGVADVALRGDSSALDAFAEKEQEQQSKKTTPSAQAQPGDADSVIWSGTDSTWTGADGIELPYKGKQGILVKHNDPPHMRPQLCTRHMSRILYLQRNTEDLALYNRVMDMVLSKTAKVVYDDRRFDEANGGYITFLAWVERFYDTPVGYKDKA